MQPHRLVLVLVLAAGCGASAKKAANAPNPNLPHVGAHDDVGDVVTGSMSAPESPGLNGPSIPGGTGAGGGTPRPQQQR